MTKTLLASAALALALGMSGSAFAGPGKTPQGIRKVDRTRRLVPLVKAVSLFWD